MEGSSETIKIVKLPHHEEEPLCETRAKYRQGKKLTAVKVYTVADESRHLLVRNVTSVDVHDELAALCQRFGPLLRFGAVDDYETERFTRVYHVQYRRMAAAKFAKGQLDGRNFFGTHLKVCYAPELETLAETADKLRWRRAYYRNGLARLRDGGKQKTRTVVGPTETETVESTPGPSTSQPASADSCRGVLIGPAYPPAMEPSAGQRHGAAEMAPPSEPEPEAPRRPRKRIVFKRKRPDGDSAPPPSARQQTNPGVSDETMGKLQLVREQIQQAVTRSLAKKRRCDEAPS